MTNKEAIEELKKVSTIDMPIRLCEAYYMSLKALDQEPSGETVSLEAFKQVMWERDIAIEQLKELGYGFGQKIEPCNDAISRQAVFDLIEHYNSDGLGTVFIDFRHGIKFADAINDLPSVNPQEPKTGHWIEKDGYDGDIYYDCSECGESWAMIDGTPWQNGMNYCPNCGAKMAESEDKCKNCKYYRNPDYTRCHKCKEESEG